jgi:hypothetical protein
MFTLDGFTWVNPSAEFSGTWKSTLIIGALPIGTTVFVINGDGSGTVQFGMETPHQGPCTYKLTDDKAKLLLDTGGYGKCIYAATFTDGGNTLTLSDPQADNIGDSCFLPLFTTFTPVART